MYIGLLSLLPLSVGGCANQQQRAKLLTVTFLDVGQGDSAVIETPSGRVVVIDGGGVPGTDERENRSEPGARVVVPFLRAKNINRVDLLVPTHADDDHAQGLCAVVQNMEVRAALLCGHDDADGADTSYARLRAAIRTRGVREHVARRGQRFDLGDGAHLEVLHPSARKVTSGASVSNNNSIVLRLVYGRARVLFAADAEEEAEDDLRQSGINLQADVLKAGHHGARRSTTAAFLRDVRPSAVVLSCGRGNNYGHPSPSTLKRLADAGVRVFRTDTQGAITLETDGNAIRLTPFLQMK